MTQQQGSNKAVLRAAFYGQALMFGAAGLVCFIFPEDVQKNLNLDAMLTSLFGAIALCFAAGDIVAAKFIFKDQDSK